MVPDKARVLVTDGETRTALAVTRSLGRAGHHVVVASHSMTPLAGASRYAGAVVTVPSPLASAEAYVEQLSRVIGEYQIDVVMPLTDQSCPILLPARAQLAPATVLGPSTAAFAAVSDKQGLMQRAPDCGLAVPAQWTLDAPDDRLPPSLLYPLVVKPHASIIDGTRLAVAYATDEAALGTVLSTLPRAAFPVLLQRRIVGPGCGVFLLRQDGRTLAAFAHRRLVEQPPSGGHSVYSESVALEDSLRERAEALLDACGFEGCAMVEFKQSRADGQYYLMEVNGRLWGSLQLAVDAGVDFPRLWLESALGHPASSAPAYRLGTRLRSTLGMLDHILVRARHDPVTLAVAADAPGLTGVAWAMLGMRPDDRQETLRSSDPGPFARDLRNWFGNRFPAFQRR